MAQREWQPVAAALAHFLAFFLFIFLWYFLTGLFYFSLELSIWAVWRLDSLFSFWSLHFYFHRFPPCPGSLYAALLFAVGISCWSSVALRCSRTSVLMSPVSYSPVLPSVIMGNVRSLPNKMGWPGIWGTTASAASLCSLRRGERSWPWTRTLTWTVFNCSGQTGRQWAVRWKEEGWLCLLMTDGATLGTSLLKNRARIHND